MAKKTKKARKTKRKSAREGTKAGAKKAVATKRRKKAKRVAAGKKAARTRKRNKSARKTKRRAKKTKSKRAKSKSKRKGGKRKSAREGTKAGAKKAVATKRRKAAARKRAAKKAARTRKRNASKGKRKTTKKSKPRKSSKKSKSTKRSASARKAAATRKRNLHDEQERMLNQGEGAYERRKNRKRSAPRTRRHHHMAAMPNPVSGWAEFAGALFGVATGGLATVGVDRYLATHALQAPSGVTGTITDIPTLGQVYNPQAPSTPLWSSFKTTGWKRLLAATLNVAIPLFISGKIKHGGAKSFFQLWGFSSLTVTTVKVAVDGTAILTGKTLIGARLFAPEASADSALAAAQTTQLTGHQLSNTGAPHGMFSGARRFAGAGNDPTHGVKKTVINLPPSWTSAPSTSTPTSGDGTEPTYNPPGDGTEPTYNPPANPPASYTSAPDDPPDSDTPPPDNNALAPVKMPCSKCSQKACAGANGGSCSDEWNPLNPTNAPVD